MRTLKYVGAAVAVLLLAALATTYGVLRGSLARLDGKLRLAGLAAPVRIERDSRGVPTIEAANRLDLAFATGFVHAQDRFFQMDLSRRLAAGELAEVCGPRSNGRRSTRASRTGNVAGAGNAPSDFSIRRARAGTPLSRRLPSWRSLRQGPKSPHGRCSTCAEVHRLRPRPGSRCVPGRRAATAGRLRAR